MKKAWPNEITQATIFRANHTEEEQKEKHITD